MVHDEDRAVLRWIREFPCEPSVLVVRQSAVVIARHSRVDRDDAEPVDVRHGVVRRVGVDAEERPGHRSALVMVAAGEHERAAEPFDDRIDDGPQQAVGLRIAAVREVARDDEGVDPLLRRLDPGQGLPQLVLGVDPAREQASARDEMGVGKVRDDMRRRRP